jgi:hypothetical protein
MIRLALSVSLMAMTLLSFAGCDLEGKKQCAWFIEYDAKRDPRLTLEGYVPVCVKNLTANKQDCRFVITADKGVQYYGKYFRYVDIHVTSVALPRIIKSIDLCQKDATP